MIDPKVEQYVYDYPRNERKTNRANSPAKPPSRNMLTKSTIPSIGENPVEYRMLTKTKRTISALTMLTIPDAAFCTVVLISAILIPPWFVQKTKKGVLTSPPNY